MEYSNITNISYIWSKIKTYIDNAITTITSSYEDNKFGNTVTLTNNTIDTTLGDVFIKNVTENITFSFTGVPNNKNFTFSIILTNGGSYNVIWPNSVKWSYGIVPSLSTNGIDVITFITPDGGNTWYGSLSLENAL